MALQKDFQMESKTVIHLIQSSKMELKKVQKTLMLEARANTH
jgi:hypothetical protein